MAQIFSDVEPGRSADYDMRKMIQNALSLGMFNWTPNSCQPRASS